jgi:hypothetical protein
MRTFYDPSYERQSIVTYTVCPTATISHGSWHLSPPDTAGSCHLIPNVNLSAVTSSFGIRAASIAESRLPHELHRPPSGRCSLVAASRISGPTAPNCLRHHQKQPSHIASIKRSPMTSRHSSSPERTVLSGWTSLPRRTGCVNSTIWQRPSENRKCDSWTERGTNATAFFTASMCKSRRAPIQSPRAPSPRSPFLSPTTAPLPWSSARTPRSRTPAPARG